MNSKRRIAFTPNHSEPDKVLALCPIDKLSDIFTITIGKLSGYLLGK